MLGDDSCALPPTRTSLHHFPLNSYHRSFSGTAEPWFAMARGLASAILSTVEGARGKALLRHTLKGMVSIETVIAVRLIS